MRRPIAFFIFCLLISMGNLIFANKKQGLPGQPFHKDIPFKQPYSIKFGLNKLKSSNPIQLYKVMSDRNGVEQVYSSEGLLTVSGGKFLFPGDLVHDVSYLAMANKKIKSVGLYQNQFVYVDDKAVFSNAWAGKLYSLHSMPQVTHFCGGKDFSFLLTDGKTIQYIKDSKMIVGLTVEDYVIDMVYDKERDLFWLLGTNGIASFDPSNNTLHRKFKGEGLTCFALINKSSEFVVGTHHGYFKIDAKTGEQIGGIKEKLPCNDITVVKEIDQQLWFGSVNGAFRLQEDGKYKYYASKRWMPSNHAIDISKNVDGSLLVLTDKGLAEIHFDEMTLHDKAMYFEKQVRMRHIRLGFNSTISGLKNGDVTSGSLEDSDNDGLWTSMYLGAEVFRYAATKSPDALQNCRESLEAMEKLYTVTHLKGFPARSFERSGYEISDVHSNNPEIKQEYIGNAGVVSPYSVWRHSEDTVWDWKSTTSSDEAIGHMFVFGVIAELMDVPDIKNKAIHLMDALMTHIVEHDMYMIDWNGKPTTWGRWNPQYVNAMPINVGDRKITSSNITSMLQTAYHFNGKKILKEKALELLYKYGYLENLMRPMKSLGNAPSNAAELAKDLSDSWNHSDDEMYFIGYWGLYRYALNDTLKKKFKEAILDHWEIERPEKEGAWNIFTAITGVKQFDLNEAIWYLQKYPIDMIEWKVKNSDRKDIEFIPTNFRRQTMKEVLPPDELPINRHNSNRFDLDGGDDNGSSEYSAGDIWLLPYWMGRYLKVISAPLKTKEEVMQKSVSPIIDASTVKKISYQDIPYQQRYSIQYDLADSTLGLQKLASDHNGNIQVLSNQGLFKPRAGALMEPGQLVKDKYYLPILGKTILSLGLYKNEFVYADEKAILSNGWAGNLYLVHGMQGCSRFAGGKDFDFLCAYDNHLRFIHRGKIDWDTELASTVMDIQFEEGRNIFWILSSSGLYQFFPKEKKMVTAFKGNGLTCFAVGSNNIWIGSHDGYYKMGTLSKGKAPSLHQQLPCTDITAIKIIDGATWFGSTQGAFMLRKNGQFDYYASKRWLPNNEVIDIAKGEEGTVLVLTTTGLAKICVETMDLEKKATYYEAIVRKRHIRYGFYSDYVDAGKGDSSSYTMRPHDSDNIWTSMYLSAELFRYLVTHDEVAKQNCKESLEAMEQLFALSGVKGLFGRCIERNGVMEFKEEVREEDTVYWYPGYDRNPSSWKHTANGEWDWRGSASIDQADGQYYALTMVAQYMDDKTLKQKAIQLLDELTGYVLENHLQLIDVDGRPTLWGRWGPEYVNRFPDMVGDKKLYASNTIAFLQIAYHFTGKEKYKLKAEQLLYKEKYLENLVRPISAIGPAPATADKWSQLMSGTWNCSDDEMYFLGYWGLYPYGLTSMLKSKFKEAIADHWKVIIKPEKDALWNFMYGAITGTKDIDLEGSIWELKRMPLDLCTWAITKSGRKDLAFIKNPVLERPTKEVLPPDERPENKHNRNLFKLDETGAGMSELGGGDVYLLPYWMGRYFGFIGAPKSVPMANACENKIKKFL